MTTCCLVVHLPVLQEGVDQGEPRVGVGPPRGPIGGRARAQRLPHRRALRLVLEGEEHQGEGPVDGARRQDIWPFI